MFACKSFNSNKNYDAYLKLWTMLIELTEMMLKIKKRLLSSYAFR